MRRTLVSAGLALVVLAALPALLIATMMFTISMLMLLSGLTAD